MIALLGFALPTSTAGTNLSAFILTCWILLTVFYKPHQQWQALRQQAVARIALLLFAVIVLSVLYTPVNFAIAWDTIDKYREFLFIPIFLLIFKVASLRQVGFIALLSAMLLTLLLSYLIAVTGWELGKGTPDNPFVFKNHITQGVLMSLTAYSLLVISLYFPRWRWWCIGLALLAAYNVLFMTQGRTGYVLLGCLALLFVFQVYRWRGLIFGSLFIVAFSALAYSHSDVLQARLDKTWHNVEAYQQGQADSSVGARLEFYQRGWQLFAERPVLGTGAGGFYLAYQELAARTDTTPTDNLHNEYLMIAVQWGSVGLGLFILLLYYLWRESLQLAKPYQWLAQGLVLVIVVGCLANSLWLDNTEGHVFAFLIGILYNEMRLKKAQQLHQAPSFLGLNPNK